MVVCVCERERQNMNSGRNWIGFTFFDGKEIVFQCP